MSDVPVFSCLTSAGAEVPAIGVCVEVSWLIETAFGPANSRLLADPGEGELNLSATEGPVGEVRGSIRKHTVLINTDTWTR